MSQRVEFVFSENAVEKFRLSFELLENDFTRRWLAALLHVLGKDDPPIWSNSGALFFDETSLRSSIEQLAGAVQKRTGVKVQSEPLRRFSTAIDLVPLRERCLAMVKTHNLDTAEHIEIRRAASRVVSAIANYVSLYAPDHHFHGEFNFETETRFFLAAPDFARFTPDRNDGWLYLDYAQAGLTPLAAYLQKSEVAPAAQNSFIPAAQLLYRDTFTYGDSEKTEMKSWIAKTLKKRRSSKKLSIGQIPLARPCHGLGREDVLEKLLTFRGAVSIEAFENDKLLTETSEVVLADFQKLKPFHPYGAGLRGDLINGTVIFARSLVALWGERWRLLIPFHVARPHVWALWFKLSWPFRKAYYFAPHVLKRARGLLGDLSGVAIRAGYYLKSIYDQRWQALEPFHKVRPVVWSFLFKLSWPFRKGSYFFKYAFQKYVRPKGGDRT